MNRVSMTCLLYTSAPNLNVHGFGGHACHLGGTSGVDLALNGALDASEHPCCISEEQHTCFIILKIVLCGDLLNAERVVVLTAFNEIAERIRAACLDEFIRVQMCIRDSIKP